MSDKLNNTESSQSSEEKQVSQETNSSTDDFGYEKPESKDSEVEDKPEEKKEEEKSSTGYDESKPEEKKEEKVEDKKEEAEKPVAGYGEDGEAAKEEEKPAEKTEEEVNSEEEMKALLGEFSENDQKSIIEFATENKLNKDQVKAYADMVKSQDSSRIEQTKQQRSAWAKELREDMEFGGENFKSSLKKVEVILEKHLPRLKKSLTDRDGMLPPYIMKDLLGLSKTLNPKTELVVGEEPGEPPKKEGKYDFLDEMYK